MVHVCIFYLARSRLIVGLACVLVAVLLLWLGEGDGTTAGAVAFSILGLISIATARKKQAV